MKSSFLSIRDILALGCPSLPTSERSLQRHAETHWKRDPAKARVRAGRGGVWEYHVSLLPPAAQLRVIASEGETVETDGKDEDAWARYEAAPDGHKKTAQQRLDILTQIDADVADSGQTETVVRKRIARLHGVSASSIANWKSAVSGVDRANWLPALLPSYQPTAKRAECHPDAWTFLCSDMLRPEKPTFSKAYRRLLDAASSKGWSPVPHERSLRRRFDVEVPEAIKVLAWEGKKGARRLIPAQRRTVSGLHAMQAVNMDGHKFDVFVNWPGYEKPIRPVMIAIQDIYSRKILAWRVSDTENKETTALVIGDMVERFGIPETLLTDNSRAFASKWLTGRSKTRFRFKIKESEPQGLLVALGIRVAWATPGHGQAKPIERSFGDFATDAIAKHPICAGAYTGNAVGKQPTNRGSRAVDRDIFVDLVNTEIARHNAQEGRRTETAKAEGLSFDQVFERSYANAIVSWPTEAQKALWLMAAERVRCRPGSGEIHFEGNRYWHVALNEYAGRQVTVRFDPEDYHKPMRVYDLEDRLICIADLVSDRGFFDQASARQTARDQAELLKTVKRERDLRAKLRPDQLADAVARIPETPVHGPQPKVKRIANSGRTVPVAEPQFETRDDTAFDSEAALAAALRLIPGGRSD